MRNKECRDISDAGVEMEELIRNTEAHVVNDRELAEIAAVKIKSKWREAAYKKDPSKKMKDLSLAIDNKLKLKNNGLSSVTFNQNIDLRGLSLSQQLPLLEQMAKEVKDVGIKMGYFDEVEAAGRVVPAGGVGENRLKDVDVKEKSDE